MSKPPKGLTHQEAADRLGVTRSRIYQLLDSGKLTAASNGVTKASVEAYHRNRRPAGRPRMTK